MLSQGIWVYSSVFGIVAVRMDDCWFNHVLGINIQKRSVHNRRKRIHLDRSNYWICDGGFELLDNKESSSMKDDFCFDRENK